MSTDVCLYRKVMRTPLEEWEAMIDHGNPWRSLDIDSEDLSALLEMVKRDPSELTTPRGVPSLVWEIGNVTWNVSPMFTRAFGLEGDDARAPWALPDNDRGGWSLYHLEGATVEATADGIRSALARARELGEDGMADLAPENGWGSYRCVERILSGMVEAMEDAEPGDYWVLS